MGEGSNLFSYAVKVEKLKIKYNVKFSPNNSIGIKNVFFIFFYICSRVMTLVPDKLGGWYNFHCCHTRNNKHMGKSIMSARYDNKGRRASIVFISRNICKLFLFTIVVQKKKALK
jgi:hypothetical protein